MSVVTAGWDLILNKHGGYLPIEIEAVPEGTVLPAGNVMVQMKNTAPEVPWLTSYLETAILRAVWYPTTVATLSREAKTLIYGAMKKTTEHPEAQIDFQLHDFGARGVSSEESAALGGLAHLVNFKGTDTISALLAGRAYYGDTMAGYSIPASEHATMTAWGENRETDAYENMLKQFGGNGNTLAVVSDSYDIYNAVSKIWGGALKDKVLQNGSTLVIRPDSGDPQDVVIEVIERLMTAFGHHINAKGYRVLPPCVRVIQGDGVNLQSIGEILQALIENGISAENVAFGMGGGLLQQVNRDTCKFAMKASAIQINGQWQDVFKSPVTDPGKASKKGRLALRKVDNRYVTLRKEDCPVEANILQPVFEDGHLLRSTTLSEIRQRAAA